MRIAIGSIMQETNTFAPTRTNLDTFAAGYIWYGDELLEHFRDARAEISGFLHTLNTAHATTLPLLAAHAYSGGKVTRAAFDTLVEQLTARLQAVLPVDGVLLALHGAMVVEDDPDAEGSLLAAVRAVVGVEVQVAASLDLHGHITPVMLQHASILVGYQTYPHIDMYETGVRTATLLIDSLHKGRPPTMALAKRRLLVSPVCARTTEGPLKQVMDRAKALERSGVVLAASLFPVQPWLDVPDLGFAVLIVTDRDQKAAQAVADDLAEQVWRERAAFEPDMLPLSEAVRIGLEASTGTIVVGDAGDAPSGGALADHTAVLRELLQQFAQTAPRPSYLTMCDAEAAQLAAARGIGNTITLAVGHKLSPELGEPVTITGRVCTVTDGTFRMTGQGANGMFMQMGLTAVLAIGAIRLVIRSLPAMEWDPAMYASVGLNPTDAALVFVKSPSHFRASFAPLAQRVLVADTPGITRANMRALTFDHVTRPLYPLDNF